MAVRVRVVVGLPRRVPVPVMVPMDTTSLSSSWWPMASCITTMTSPTSRCHRGLLVFGSRSGALVVVAVAETIDRVVHRGPTRVALVVVAARSSRARSSQ